MYVPWLSHFYRMYIVEIIFPKYILINSFTYLSTDTFIKCKYITSYLCVHLLIYQLILSSRRICKCNIAKLQEIIPVQNSFLQPMVV